MMTHRVEWRIQDDWCYLYPGEHPRIVSLSVADYFHAVPGPLAALEAGVGRVVTPDTPAENHELLIRIFAGACRSFRLKEDVSAMVERIRKHLNGLAKRP